MRFIVRGIVLGKPRPRVNKNGITWTPKKFKDYERLIASEYISNGGKTLDGLISVKVDTFRSMPKSRPKKIESEHDVFKPDIDNVLKLVLDALNCVAYKDDKQVISVQGIKHDRKRVEEHIVITVEEIK